MGMLQCLRGPSSADEADPSSRKEGRQTTGQKKKEGGAPAGQPQEREKRPKSLKKRDHSRGHGTLNMLDVEHAQCVDVDSIDITSPDINKLFGTFGALPVGSKRLWEADLRLGKGQTETLNLKIAAKRHKLIVRLNGRASLLGASKQVLVKAWVLNKHLGHSIYQESKVLNWREARADFDFDAMQAGGAALELRVQVISQCKLSAVQLSSELHELQGGASPKTRPASRPPLGSLGAGSRPSASSMSAAEAPDHTVFLDGVDQTADIRRVRHHRAKSQELEKARRKSTTPST